MTVLRKRVYHSYQLIQKRETTTPVPSHKTRADVSSQRDGRFRQNLNQARATIGTQGHACRSEGQVFKFSFNLKNLSTIKMHKVDLLPLDNN